MQVQNINKDLVLRPTLGASILTVLLWLQENGEVVSRDVESIFHQGLLGRTQANVIFPSFPSLWRIWNSIYSPPPKCVCFGYFSYYMFPIVLPLFPNSRIILFCTLPKPTDTHFIIFWHFFAIIYPPSNDSWGWNMHNRPSNGGTNARKILKDGHTTISSLSHCEGEAIWEKLVLAHTH